MVTGGYWQDPRSQEWVCASPAVQAHIQQDSSDARLLGVQIAKPIHPGKMMIRSELSPNDCAGARAAAPLLSWAQTSSVNLEPSLTPPGPSTNTQGTWQSASTLVTTNGDITEIGSEVLVCLDVSPFYLHRFFHFGTTLTTFTSSHCTAQYLGEVLSKHPTLCLCSRATTLPQPHSTLCYRCTRVHFMGRASSWAAYARH